MNKRLIYAEDAIKALEALFVKRLMQFDYDSYEKADEKTQLVCDGISESIGCLLNLPSAQPERMKGRWTRKNDGVYCSACYKGWDFMTGVPAEVETEYKFCPNCGAKMEVEHEQVPD